MNRRNLGRGKLVASNPIRNKGDRAISLRNRPRAASVPAKYHRHEPNPPCLVGDLLAENAKLRDRVARLALEIQHLRLLS
jgi:hypothetical protein